MRSLLTVVLALGTAVLPGAQAPAVSGTITSAPTIDVTAADVRKMIAIGENNPLKSINAGDHVVFVWYEHRSPGTTQAGTGILHSELTEIYLIVDGGAMIRTGGQVVNPKSMDIKTTLPGTVDVPRFPSPTFSGKMESGTTRKVSTGDIVVMPPNTIHSWEAVDPSGIGYLIFRIDPEHRLQAGYTNPALVE